MLAPNFHVNAPVPPDPVEKAPTYSPEEVPSCGGHGTLEILEVTRYLEKHGIECCIVGVSALIFYGAGRVRDVWPSNSFPCDSKRPNDLGIQTRQRLVWSETKE
jgi:hypothetical protein